MSTRIDSGLLKALNITAAEVEANRAGMLTEMQRQKLAQIRGCRDKSSLMGMISIFLSLGVVFSIGYTQGDFSRDPDAQIAFLLTIGVVSLLMLVGIIWTFRQGRDFDRERISIAEGEVKTLVRQVQLRSGRYPRYELTIGKRRFFVESEAALKAFKDGRHYRIYYIKYPSVPIMLSAERLEA